MTRIGIMSFAHMHAHGYAACLDVLPDAALVAVWDDDLKRGRAAARQYGCRFTGDIKRFLSLGLDGVIVCSENAKHRYMVEAAAAAGLAILCEKPIATTLDDARAMISACEEAGVPFGIAFPCRFATVLEAARQRLQAGELGALHAAACTNNGQFPGGWFADPELSGGGAVMDHTVHVADALRWMTGKEFTSVYCACGNLLHEGIATDDVGSLHLEMEGGVIVSHVASWNRPSTFPTWGDVTMELIGSKGTIRLDAFNQKIDVYDDTANTVSWVGWGDDSNLTLVQDFVEAAAVGRPMAATGHDGLRALEVTLAAYQSAQKGQPVLLRGKP